ncbi:thermonuclease family protein [Streptomyces kaniharaensis]|uniref:Thermonuclease family protein n=1 Tax=Streptomyces kaniharaensis TaxID=212423 RepID=A0A6N7L3P3_9ACTN|nr:nuclease [Streptomyces kaniharaensis]MQS17168.1 thermonuclease family protein [Streptomyces kaniharaensis]
MTMLLVQGSYKIIGSEPDGDTIHFVPTDPTVWNKLPACTLPKHNATTGETRLRLDGIDALETHYDRTGPSVAQPLEFAHKAAEELLTFLGFSNVQRTGEKVTAATPAQTPGFILTQGADKLGRCVALIGAGAPPAADGTQVQVDVALLRTTANHHLLSLGLVYPTFYSKLPQDLRTELTTVARQARTNGLGLWPKDVTTATGGAVITGMSSLTNDVVILPKLFRRLVDHFNLVEQTLACFPAYLAGKEDNLKVLPANTPELTLKPLVQIINGNAIRMTNQPEDIVYAEG